MLEKLKRTPQTPVAEKVSEQKTGASLGKFERERTKIQQGAEASIIGTRLKITTERGQSLVEGEDKEAFFKENDQRAKFVAQTAAAYREVYGQDQDPWANYETRIGGGQKGAERATEDRKVIEETVLSTFKIDVEHGRYLSAAEKAAALKGLGLEVPIDSRIYELGDALTEAVLKTLHPEGGKEPIGGLRMAAYKAADYVRLFPDASPRWSREDNVTLIEAARKSLPENTAVVRRNNGEIAHDNEVEIIRMSAAISALEGLAGKPNIQFDAPEAVAA
jgi:hypothetical protein